MSLMKKISWAHKINLNGYITPGGFTQFEWPNYKELVFPPELFIGKTALDIGAWDGLYSFYFEKLGATSVTAMDYCCWGGNEPRTTDKEDWKSNCCSSGDGTGFAIAYNTLKSNVKTIRLNVYDLSPEITGRFDITFFSGVLYHLKHPMLALEQVSSVTNYLMIVETHISLATISNSLSGDFIEIYTNRELADDPSNFCGPSKSALTKMILSVGFKRVQVVYENGPRITLHCFK